MNVTESYESKNALIKQHAGMQNSGGKYLTFLLAEEEYGLQILKVREINGIMDITAVPRMPKFMKGVINLRGKVIPVIDLRTKFDLQAIEYTEQTCIIVVDVGRDIGIIVDTVSEVLDIPGDNIEPPPPMGINMQQQFILGMGKVGDSVKILLNIDNVLSAEEMAAVTERVVEQTEDKAPEELSN